MTTNDVGYYLEHSPSDFEYDNTELFKELDSADEDSHPLVLEKIVKNNTKLILHLISKRFGNGIQICRRLRITSDDLFSIGMFGLLKATNSFDYTKGIKFATYVGTVVNNEFSMFLRKNSKLFSDLSGDEEVGDANDGGGGVSIFELIPSDKDSYSSFVEDSHNSEFLNQLGKVLTERERTVIALYYYQNIGQTEIGEIVGLSQSMVSRVRRNAVAKAKKLYEAMEEDDYARMD